MRAARSLAAPVALLVLSLAAFATADPCDTEAHSTCSTCLTDPKFPNCGWCAEGAAGSESFTGKCLTERSSGQQGCKAGAWHTKTSHVVGSKPDAPLSDTLIFKPQELTVALRPGVPLEVPVLVRPVANYPLDLYYLMDLSASMHDDLDTLKERALQVADWVASRVSGDNFRIGFGSFVDKPGLPFADPDCYSGPADGDVSCGCDCDNDGKRKHPYLFKNTLKLQGDKNEFVTRVNSVNYNGNIDKPEGGMDALLQLAVCDGEEGGEEFFGWRDEARHMALYLSDADFHFGGDAKLLGIQEPNSGRCRMRKDCPGCTASKEREVVCEDCQDAEYGHLYDPLGQDYPTLGQIKAALEKANIVPIFAVVPEEVSIYEQVVQFMQFGAVTELSRNSDNIIDVLDKAYSELIGSVALSTIANGNEDFVQSIRVSGKADPGLQPPQAFVDNVSEKQTITFLVTLQNQRAIEAQTANEVVTLKVIGYGDVTINVQLDDSCACEKDREQCAPDAPNCRCENDGTLECGACVCKEGFSGSDCQCEGEKTVCTKELLDSLRNPDDQSICSGHGTCECGKCKCQVADAETKQIGYSGALCECKSTCATSVPYEGGPAQECGGPKQGKCVCGQCQCLAGFSNIDCGCATGATSEKYCTPEGLNLISKVQVCNGGGDCRCGRCKCTKSGFSGDRCEICDPGPQGLNKCPRVRACSAAATCNRCFDSAWVGDLSCSWCPGVSADDLPLEKDGSKPDPIPARCLPAADAWQSCGCSAAPATDKTCMLRTSAAWCVDCHSNTDCASCSKAARPNGLVGLNNPQTTYPGAVCTWCSTDDTGAQCISTEELHTCSALSQDQPCKPKCIEYSYKYDGDAQLITPAPPRPSLCDTMEWPSVTSAQDRADLAATQNSFKQFCGDDPTPPSSGIRVYGNVNNTVLGWCYDVVTAPADVCLPENFRYVQMRFDQEACPTSSSPGAMIGAIVGAALGAGILLMLIFKLITWYKDKKEWEEWEKERANSKWQASQNPLFKSSVSEYVNPTFVGNEAGQAM